VAGAALNSPRLYDLFCRAIFSDPRSSPLLAAHDGARTPERTTILPDRRNPVGRKSANLEAQKVTGP
ncbi:MAG TPA: hypothetical protein VL475_02810, partial [Planctomycetaceae bacterium]|nr:hypothetical protein [Planctomycetaceae bacterium]